jgi:hypothetical protein
MCEEFFWRARNFLRFAITKQNQQLVFVAFHSDTRIVRDNDIAILFAQLFRGVCFEVIRFRCKADKEKFAILSLA